MSNYEIGKQALDAIINKKIEDRKKALNAALSKKFKEIIKEFPEIRPSGARDITLYTQDRKQVNFFMSWTNPTISSELADLLFDNVRGSVIKNYISEIVEKVEKL